MSAFPPFLGVSPAAPRSLLGRRNLCRDSCLLWPLFSPVASLSICWWGHGPSVSLRSGDRGWLKQRRVVTWSWASQTLLAPYPPLTLPFPHLRFGVLFISASICILTRVLWGTPHGNGSKLLLWS